MNEIIEKTLANLGWVRNVSYDDDVNWDKGSSWVRFRISDGGLADMDTFSMSGPSLFEISSILMVELDLQTKRLERLKGIRGSHD